MVGWLEGWVGRVNAKAALFPPLWKAPTPLVSPTFPGASYRTSLTSGSSSVRGLLWGFNDITIYQLLNT